MDQFSGRTQTTSEVWSRVSMRGVQWRDVESALESLVAKGRVEGDPSDRGNPLTFEDVPDA